jgi:hypothetical protein
MPFHHGFVRIALLWPARHVAGLPHPAVMRPLPALAIAVLLSCCASSGGTAAIHEKCGVSPKRWTLLAAPPGAEAGMLAAAGVSNDGKSGKLHWFGSGNGQVMLCRVASDNRTSNSLLGRNCFSMRWIFSERDGAWQPEGDPSMAFCGNY